MRPLKGVEVVQLKGGISFSNVKSYAWETLTLFANAFHTLPKYLPLPLVFDNPNISEMVMQDRHIKHIMEIGKEAQVAIFTVGSVDDDALLFRLGYFSEEEKKLLKKRPLGMSAHVLSIKTDKFVMKILIVVQLVLNLRNCVKRTALF